MRGAESLLHLYCVVYCVWARMVRACEVTPLSIMDEPRAMAHRIYWLSSQAFALFPPVSIFTIGPRTPSTVYLL